jgi:hypothetical protein
MLGDKKRRPSTGRHTTHSNRGGVHGGFQEQRPWCGRLPRRGAVGRPCGGSRLEMVVGGTSGGGTQRMGWPVEGSKTHTSGPRDIDYARDISQASDASSLALQLFRVLCLHFSR